MPPALQPFPDLEVLLVGPRYFGSQPKAHGERRPVGGSYKMRRWKMSCKYYQSDESWTWRWEFTSVNLLGDFNDKCYCFFAFLNLLRDWPAGKLLYTHTYMKYIIYIYSEDTCTPCIVCNVYTLHITPCTRGTVSLYTFGLSTPSSWLPTDIHTLQRIR